MSTTFTMPKKQLTWLITGSSSGLGLSLTRIVQAGGHKLDVDSPNSPKIIKDLETSGQEIDVLVNNAGFSIFSPIETSAEDEIRAQMESMYFGPLRLIRAVLPHMRKRRFGVIVNMSSGAALEARDTMGAYAGAKAGLDALTKVLAKEVASFNIRALTVALGTFNTNMVNAAVFGKYPLPEDYKESVSEQTIQLLKSGKFPIHGDKDKAMKVVYQVVMGEGAGTGLEAERFLPLGIDMTARVKLVQSYLAHSLEVFEDVSNSVKIDK